MSKSKKNYPPPDEVLNEFGADALRAYLINSPIVRAEPLRFQKAGVKEVIRTTLLPLVNAWSFFTQYANVDGWDPKKGLCGTNASPAPERGELDRWLLSMLQSLVDEVNTQMEGYYLYRVVPPVLDFIDHLTNWYIRRSRRRFWRSVDDLEALQDKANAYSTLYETLVTFSKVLAPVLPFLSEAIYQHLVVAPGIANKNEDSVHLCQFPEVQPSLIDRKLEQQIHLSRQVVSMGRALRERHKLKTRQPLSAVILVHHDEEVRKALRDQARLVSEELNVKEVRVEVSDERLTTVSFKANYKTLGRRFGKSMKDAAAKVSNLQRDDWKRLQEGQGIDILGQEIHLDDVIVHREALEEVVIETQDALLVALETELTLDLLQEGMAREITRKVQQLRKDSGLEVSDRIELTLQSLSTELIQAIEANKERVANEVLASSIQLLEEEGSGHVEDINGQVVNIKITKI
jgi:isoleucyl-tRNA synthetase